MPPTVWTSDRTQREQTMSELGTIGQQCLPFMTHQTLKQNYNLLKQYFTKQKKFETLLLFSIFGY